MTASLVAVGTPPPDTHVAQRRFVFVVEQALGHVVHAMNIERVLGRQPNISATVLRVTPGATPGIPPLPIVGNWSLQASWAARAALGRQLAISRADALFIHTQVAALLSCRFMRAVPTVVSLDATPINFDTMAQAYRHVKQPAPVEWVKRRVTRRALLAARSVVTWSRWAANSVAQDYGVGADRVHVVPPGVDLSRFRPRRGEREPGPVRILFVGGDFERKGGPELVSAVQALGPAAELDVVSPVTPSSAAGPERPSVRVHHDVAANSPALLKLYQRADIFALPSHGDCTPLAVAEALASGLPIISTGVGALPELVRPDHNGLLVPPGSRDQLAAALEALIQRPELRARMGARSRRLAELEHDVHRNCRRIFDLMDSLSTAGR